VSLRGVPPQSGHFSWQLRDDEAISFSLGKQGDCFLSGSQTGAPLAMTYYLVSELKQKFYLNILQMLYFRDDFPARDTYFKNDFINIRKIK
jgi:hypothetical protein